MVGRAKRSIVFWTISLFHFIHYLLFFCWKLKMENYQNATACKPANVTKKETQKNGNRFFCSLVCAFGRQIEIDMATEPKALNAMWFYSIFGSIVIDFDSLMFFFSSQFFIRHMESALVTFVRGANHMCDCAPIRGPNNSVQQSKSIVVTSLGRWNAKYWTRLNGNQSRRHRNKKQLENGTQLLRST